MRKLTAVVFTLVLTSCPQTDAPAPPEVSRERPTGPIRFGVLPAVDADKTREIYGPLVSAMGGMIDRPVQLHLAKNYESMIHALVTGEVQVAQVSSNLYATAATLQAKAKQPIHVLAQERRPADSPRRGVFVVKPNHSAQSLADLEGKTIAYVAKDSSSGYVYPRMKLRSAGLDPETFFDATILAGSHDAVVKEVKAGRADVGAISELTAALAGLRVVERTDPVPDDAIISIEGTSELERASLTHFFLHADTNPSLGNYFIARGIVGYSAAQIEVLDRERAEVEEPAE